MTTATGSRLGSELTRSVFGSHVRNLVVRVLAYIEVARQRRQLLTLNDRMLKDMGVGRIDTLQEARRGFWDIPDSAA